MFAGSVGAAPACAPRNLCLADGDAFGLSCYQQRSLAPEPTSLREGPVGRFVETYERRACLPTWSKEHGLFSRACCGAQRRVQLVERDDQHVVLDALELPGANDADDCEGTSAAPAAPARMQPHGHLTRAS